MAAVARASFCACDHRGAGVQGDGSTSGDIATGSARIEIVLAHDRRVIIDERVDPVALSRVLDMRERR